MRDKKNSLFRYTYIPQEGRHLAFCSMSPGHLNRWAKSIPSYPAYKTHKRQHQAYHQRPTPGRYIYILLLTLALELETTLSLVAVNPAADRAIKCRSKDCVAPNVRAASTAIDLPKPLDAPVIKTRQREVVM